MKLRELFNQILTESNFRGLNRKDTIWIKPSGNSTFKRYSIKWISKDSNGEFIEASDGYRTLTIYDSDIPSKFEISKEDPKQDIQSQPTTTKPVRKVIPLSKKEFVKTLKQAAYSNDGEEYGYSEISDIAESLMSDRRLVVYVCDQLKRSGRISRNADSVKTSLVKQYIVDHMEGFI